jgi:alpha-mannosidase
MSHFHYDPVWTNSQAGETMRAFSIVHQQLEYAAAEPRFKFALCEMDYLKPYWDAYPRNRKPLLDLVRAGNVEFNGGYSEPDEAEVGGEALIRNFIYGKIYKEAEFGVKVRTAAQLDVFGHAVQLPQILGKTGHNFAIFSRGNLTDMPSEFYWLAPDGSNLLTKSQGYGGNASEVLLARMDKSYFSLTNNTLIISGGDFQEPDRSIGSYIKNTKTFQTVSGLPRDFFESVLAELREKNKIAPLISRDHTPLLPGCYTSRIDTKIANRIAENTLADAEKFASIAALYGAQYPWASIDKAWRIILFGQHHDGLTGSDSENVNLDLLAGWREAVDIASGVRGDSMKFLAARASSAAFAGKKNVRPLVLFNSLNWTRTEPAEVEVSWPAGVPSFALFDGNKKQVPYQILAEKKSGAKITWARIAFVAENVPSLGYATWYVAGGEKPAASPYGVKSAGVSLESNFWKLKADPSRGGGLVSLVDRRTGKEYLNPAAGVGNEFFAIKENSDKVEGPWSIHSTGQVWRSGEHSAKVGIEKGPVFSRIIVEAAPVRADVKIFDGSDNVKRVEKQEVLPRLVQEIIVYNKHPRIDFRTNILDYKETDFLFKAGFPASVRGALPVFEERFAAVGRDMNDQDFLFYDFWREPGVKKGREYPAVNWVDLTSPARLTFARPDGTPAASFALAIGELVINDQNESRAAANKLAVALARKGVTTTPTLDANPRTNEYYGFRVALGVKGKNIYADQLAAGLDKSLKSNLDAAVAKDGFGFLFISPADSITSTPDRKKITVLLVIAKDAASLDKAAARLIDDLDRTGGITLPADANAAGIDSLVEDAGLALINNGMPGNSVEHNGTITLTLLRSSTGRPSGSLYSRNLETENWNHRYSYAILPHEGDWMKAKVWRAGHEFNNPLEPVIGGSCRKAEWPPAMSFLATDGTDAVISALKMKGFPYIDKKQPAAGAPALVLRIYNPTGFATAGKVNFHLPVASAKQADMLENETAAAPSSGKSFSVSLDPFAIETYVFKPEAKAAKPAARPGPAGEPLAVFPARYWETNLGAAVQGFQPVSLVLEPGPMDLDKKTMTVYVTAANNTADRTFSGNIGVLSPGKNSGPAAYSIKPGEIFRKDIVVSGFDPNKLEDSYIAARVKVDGTTLEDAMTFSAWKTFEGDPAGAAKPDFDDSGWKRVPLARFWSRGFAKKGTFWFRREIVIPANSGDKPLHFERAPGAEITVYLDGVEIRTEKDGRSYSPLFSGSTKPGGKSVLAIRVVDAGGEGGMYAWGLEGSETMYSLPMVKFASEKVAVKPGGASKIKLSISNPYALELDVSAQFVSPVETWPGGGRYSLVQAGPAVKNLTIVPKGKADAEFEVSAPPDALPGPYWAMIKLLFAGRTSYSDPVDIVVK